MGPRTRGGVMTAMCCKLKSHVGCSAHAADSYGGKKRKGGRDENRKEVKEKKKGK